MQKTLSGSSVEDEKKAVDMIENLIKAFMNPIVGHPMWADTITEEQKARIKIERLKQIKEANGAKISEGTEYEALVYVMTVSLAQPLTHHWYNIYCYLFRKFYPEQANQIFDEHEGIKLDSCEQTELIGLRRWLWKTQNKK